MQTSSFAAKNHSGSNRTAGRFLLIALLALIFCPLSALAQGCTSPTFTWSGGAAGSWNTTTNWTPNGTPTTTSNTCINTANSAVTVSNGSTGTLQLGLSTDSLGISDNTTLTVAGSSIQNAGAITLNSGGDNTILSITGSTTLSGLGTLTMSNHFQNFILGGGTLTNQSTIQGSGQIGNGNLTLVNSGTINANQSVELLINPNGGTTNTGTMEATAGGTLEFRTDGVTNTSGTILASGTNSIVDLNGVSVTNGTLTTASGGLIQAYGGTTLTTLTISSGSTVNILDNNTVSLGAGTITNNGSINENSLGDNTILSVAGSTTLAGTGTLTLSNHLQNFIQGGGTLTNNETIQGSGQIGNGNLTLVNNGTIDANQSTELVINPNGGTTNTKTMEATAGGTMEFRGDAITNTGVGTILSTGTGSVVDLNGVTVNGGTLTTTSGGLMQAYGGAVLNGVTISSGSAVHVLDNNTVQLNTGTITNKGTINVDSAGNNTLLQILGGPVTLTGGGTVVLSDHQQNFIQDTTGGTTLTNVNNTISGSGQIGNGNMSLINDAGGIVNAVSAVGNSLVINPGSAVGAGTTNLGLMEASSGGTLVLDNLVTNTGGTIEALAGGVVNLNGTDLVGGTLTSVGTGFIQGLSSAILDGTSGHAVTLTAGSNLFIPDNNNISATGTLTNNGTLTLNSIGDNTLLNVLSGNTLTLTGTGTLQLSNQFQNFIQGGGTLINQETIQGSGQIGNGNLTLVNSHTINANQSVELLINPNGGTTNTGTMEATAGGTLEFRSFAVTNTGGTILASGAGSIVDLNGISITGGTLTSASGGIFQAYANTTLNPLTISAGSTLNVLDNNTVSLGAGTITNNGAMNENSGGDNTIISVAGSTTLAGTGTLTLSNHFQNFIMGGGTLTNQETIQGSGQIGNGNLILVNNGTIDANQSTELLINPNGGTTNTKTMEATAGGTMEFQTDPVTNTGVGTILAAGTGSIVDFNGATVNGGTLTTSLGGLMQAYGGAVLNGITLSSGSTLNVPDNNSVDIEGTITNTGTINENSGGDNTFITLLGSTTLTGTGKLVLSPHAQNFINGTGTLTNQSTIEGEGHIGNGDIGLVNSGSILANETGTNAPSTLIIDTGAAGFTNNVGTKNGILNVSAKNTLIIEGGPFNNMNTSTGTLTGGVYDATGTLEFAAGTMGIVTNDATIALISSTGAILNTSESNASALSGFTTNGTKGSFSVTTQKFTDINIFTNQGTLIAGSGGTLDFSSGLTNFNSSTNTLTGGTYSVTGTLEFPGANIVVNNAIITLTGTTPKILNSTTTLSALTGFNDNKGTFTVNGGTFTDANSFTNTGTLAAGAKGLFNASGGLTNFNSGTLTGGSYTLTTTGQIQFNNEGFTNDIVTNDAKITLAGVDTTVSPFIDQTGGNALANFATNGSTGSLLLTTDRNFSTTGSLTNAGIVNVGISSGTGKTMLTIGGGGSYNQTGGTTTVDGVLSASGGINISGGFLYGTALTTNGTEGTLIGAVDLTGGTLNPGNAVKLLGTIDITGTFAESSSGVLNIDLDGTVAGTKYDVLNVSGAATLGGTLTFVLNSAFKPVVGDTWDVLNYASETGSFTTVNLPTAPAGDHYVFSCGATDCTLTLDAGAAITSATKGTVSASPAKRVTRGTGSVASVSNNHEPLAILSLATCSAARMLVSISCGERAAATLSHGNELHAVAFAGSGLGTVHNNVAHTNVMAASARSAAGAVHNNVMVATRSMSSARGGASNEPTASASVMARLYVCAYMPSTLARNMGCN